MTSIAVIENKISSTRKYLDILENYKQFSRDDITNDIDRKGAVERYLYLVMQASIDLSEAVISYKKFRKPSAMSESFYILEEADIIPSDLREQMVNMTGFRNIIAHDYENLNYDIVYDVLQNRMINIEKFLDFIKKVG